MGKRETVLQALKSKAWIRSEIAKREQEIDELKEQDRRLRGKCIANDAGCTEKYVSQMNSAMRIGELL